MPELHLTGDTEADKLLSKDPLVLLTGVPLEQYFSIGGKGATRLRQSLRLGMFPWGKRWGTGEVSAGI